MSTIIFTTVCSLGKTLECIGLISVHPHSPQPFPQLPPSPADAAASASSMPLPPVDGTRSLTQAIASGAAADLAIGLRELARFPTHASLSFEVANGRALGTFKESSLPAYRSFVAPQNDPLTQLGQKDGAIMESRATLVVAPSSLIGQWEREVKKW